LSYEWVIQVRFDYNFYRVWFQQVVPLGRLDPLGASHLVLNLSCISPSVGLADRRGHVATSSARSPQENVRYNLVCGTEQTAYGLTT
jgi:hypothetical protein